MHEHSLDVRRNPFVLRKLLPSDVDLQKILTATNAAACVHTRIATYLGGCERSSFHDSTKFQTFTGSGFLWFNRQHVGAKCRFTTDVQSDRKDLRQDRRDLNNDRKDIRSTSAT